MQSKKKGGLIAAIKTNFRLEIQFDTATSKPDRKSVV